MGGIVGTPAWSRGGGGTSSRVEKRNWNDGRLERKEEGGWVGREGPQDPVAALGEGSRAGGGDQGGTRGGPEVGVQALEKQNHGLEGNFLT